MMRIVLDAYFDNNFGDDLFINTLLKRYSDSLFYTFWRKTPENVMNRAAEFNNLVILPQDCMLRKSWPFDAYVMIGGDVLPDGIDYTDRIGCMKHVKENGGFVAMLGFSLYETYGEKTIRDLKLMAKLADTIVIRDHYSAERFKALVPEAKVTEATDMVFTIKSKMLCKKSKTLCKKNILGIIPRRKLYSSEEEYLAYCRGQAFLADSYLRKFPEARVRFLAYSTGEYDDKVTIQDIIAQMTFEVQKTGCIEQVNYEGNIQDFSTAIQECSALVSTRFHGLVFALIYRKPFVPVPYEVKLTQLLDELCYEGVRIPYGKEVTSDMAEQVIAGLECFAISEEQLQNYEKKAECFFDGVDSLYQQNIKNRKYSKTLCIANETRGKLEAEKQMLTE